MGQPQPLVRFEGHTDEVNAVKWDPSGKCSPRHSDASMSFDKNFGAVAISSAADYQLVYNGQCCERVPGRGLDGSTRMAKRSARLMAKNL